MTTSTPPGQRRKAPRWLLTLSTFVLGVVVGIVAVGLLSSGKPDFPTSGSPATTQSPTPEPTSPAAGASAAAQVNPACLEVINEAQQISNILTGVGQAATDVDLQRLDEIVRELQPIQPELERDLRACQVDTSVGSGSGQSEPPVVAPPTAAPS